MKTNPLNLKQIAKKLLYTIIFLAGISYYSKACTANFTYTTGVNGQVNFTSTSTGVSAYTEYNWDANDGSGLVSTGLTNTYHHTYIANGTYQVLLYIYDSLAVCNDSIRLSVTVSNVTTPCTLHAGASATNGLAGQVLLTSTSLNTNANTLYFWTPGDGSPRVQWNDTLTHKYIYNGFYAATITVEDTGNAFCIDSNQVFIYV